MATPSGERKVRGTARVAFIAHLDTITAELGQGHTAQAIYERHQVKLGNSISYQQFARYVRQLREDGMVQSPLSRSAPRPLSPAKPPPPPLPPEPKPQTSAQLTPEGPPPHARHEPRARTFTFDGNPKQDDKSRLIGGPSRTPKD